MKLLTLTRIYDSINKFLMLAASFLLVFVMLAVSREVFVRYFVGTATLWLTEICEYILLYLPFLAAAWVLTREGHVKNELVLNMLKPRTRALIQIITSFICAIVFLVITWYGLKVVWQDVQIGYYISSPLMPPKALIVGIIPLGSFLLFIQFLRRGCDFVNSHRVLDET